eukprot:212135_1
MDADKKGTCDLCLKEPFDLEKCQKCEKDICNNCIFTKLNDTVICKHCDEAGRPNKKQKHNHNEGQRSSGSMLQVLPLAKNLMDIPIEAQLMYLNIQLKNTFWYQNKRVESGDLAGMQGRVFSSLMGGQENNIECILRKFIILHCPQSFKLTRASKNKHHIFGKELADCSWIEMMRKQCDEQHCHDLWLHLLMGKLNVSDVSKMSHLSTMRSKITKTKSKIREDVEGFWRNININNVERTDIEDFVGEAQLHVRNAASKCFDQPLTKAKQSIFEMLLKQRQKRRAILTVCFEIVENKATLFNEKKTESVNDTK